MIKSLVLSTLISAASARQYPNVTIPVSLTSENALFNLETPLTKIEVTNFALNLARQGSPAYPMQIQEGVSLILYNT